MYAYVHVCTRVYLCWHKYRYTCIDNVCSYVNTACSLAIWVCVPLFRRITDWKQTTSWLAPLFYRESKREQSERIPGIVWRTLDKSPVGMMICHMISLFRLINTTKSTHIPRKSRMLRSAMATPPVVTASASSWLLSRMAVPNSLPYARPHRSPFGLLMLAFLYIISSNFISIQSRLLIYFLQLFSIKFEHSILHTLFLWDVSP